MEKSFFQPIQILTKLLRTFWMNTSHVIKRRIKNSRGPILYSRFYLLTVWYERHSTLASPGSFFKIRKIMAHYGFSSCRVSRPPQKAPPEFVRANLSWQKRYLLELQAQEKRGHQVTMMNPIVITSHPMVISCHHMVIPMTKHMGN